MVLTQELAPREWGLLSAARCGSMTSRALRPGPRLTRGPAFP